MLAEKIQAIHKRSRGTYGVPRIPAELKTEGYRVGRNRVAPLMRSAGLRGVSRRKGPTTTIPGNQTSEASDLVERNFSAEQPNELLGGR